MTEITNPTEKSHIFKPETKNNLIFLAVCLAIVFLIYGKTIVGDFVFDDRGILEHKTFLENASNLGDIALFPYWSEEAGLYRPITLLSYSFNFIFLGSDSAGFHLINLILYALSGWLFFILVKKLFQYELLAYLSALIFLFLPIHTEAVANIIGRAEILALFFSLLFFLELTRGEKIKSQWRAGLWFFLALGSKETAIAALPIAIFILHIQEVDFFLGKIFRKYFHLIVSLITGLLVYFGLRFMVLGNSHFLGVKTSLVENPLMFVSDQDRIFTALKILWLYFTKIFWPLNLCSDYSYNQITTLHTFLNHETILGLVVLLFFLISIFIFWKRIPLLSLAAAFFLFSFLPVSNLIFPIGTIAGERLMYYPSVGISLFLAYLIFSLIKIRTKPIFGYFILTSFLTLMMFYGSVSYLRANDWLTEKNLFISAAKCAPNSVLSRSNLGAIYYLNGNLKTAKEELLNAQKIYPNYSKGVNNLGLVYWKEGDREKARQLFLQAANSEFPYTGAYENLAMLNLEEDNSDEARQWLNKLYSNNGALVDNYIATWIAQKKTK